MKVDHKHRGAIEEAVRRWRRRVPPELRTFCDYDCEFCGADLGVEAGDLPRAVVEILEELHGVELVEVPPQPSDTAKAISGTHVSPITQGEHNG